jgi:hypothetical protein
MQKRKTVSPQMSLLGGIAGEEETQVSGFHLVPGRPSITIFSTLTSSLFSFILRRIFDFDAITCQSCSITASNITNEREGSSTHLRGGDENAHLTG